MKAVAEVQVIPIGVGVSVRRFAKMKKQITDAMLRYLEVGDDLQSSG